MATEKLTAECNVQAKILLAASRLRNRLFRNNVGLFKTIDGRTIKTGLHNGSSDLIGWTQVKITPDMVGKTVAIFTAIECKKEGFVMPKNPNETLKGQINFIEQVKKSGGYAGFARSDEEYKNILK